MKWRSSLWRACQGDHWRSDVYWSGSTLSALISIFLLPNSSSNNDALNDDDFSPLEDLRRTYTCHVWFWGFKHISHTTITSVFTPQCDFRPTEIYKAWVGRLSPTVTSNEHPCQTKTKQVEIRRLKRRWLSVADHFASLVRVFWLNLDDSTAY